MSLKTNEHRGFYPGSERYRELYKKKNKINKKRNGNARKTDNTMALLPNNLPTNNISELISDKL